MSEGRRFGELDDGNRTLLGFKDTRIGE